MPCLAITTLNVFSCFEFLDITCDGLRNPNNGLVLFNGDMVNRNFEFGAEAVYSCDTGFSLVGISNRTCTGDGSSTTGAFNGVAPTCEREYLI